MGDIFKSALLVLNADKTAFLAVKKKDPKMQEWIMPGGKIEVGETPEEALVREIQEELGCEVAKGSLEYINDYEAPAAGAPDILLHLKLYGGSISGEPKASSELSRLGWLTKEDTQNMEASETIRDWIIPDLVAKGILL